MASTCLINAILDSKVCQLARLIGWILCRVAGGDLSTVRREFVHLLDEILRWNKHAIEVEHLFVFGLFNRECKL